MIDVLWIQCALPRPAGHEIPARSIPVAPICRGYLGADPALTRSGSAFRGVRNAALQIVQLYGIGQQGRATAKNAVIPSEAQRSRNTLTPSEATTKAAKTKKLRKATALT